MKRHCIALLIHPYKNILVSPDVLRASINVFLRRFLDIAAAVPAIRLNLTMPAYMLTHADPLLLAELREVQKRDCLEWLMPGYTEPFMSFSPQWLSRENIRAGAEAYAEFLSIKPTGYAAPFSNWEPSSIDTMRECGMTYVVLSRAVMPREVQHICGYWITEHLGTSIAVFPFHILHHYSAPANIADWIDGIFQNDSTDEMATKFLGIEYLVPLVAQDGIDSGAWLHTCATALDSLLNKYQVVRLSEFPSLSYPTGLNYIPPQLVFRRDEEATLPYFSNYLHTFEQAGIIQRKMMDIAERLYGTKDNKDSAPFVRQLFFVQDINRYIPGKNGGFANLSDRLWTYSKLIGIEQELHKRDHIQGGQIRIADLLRNGTKSIVLTNKPLMVCIDHRNGGQVFELDYRDRAVNLCAGYNPQTHSPPRILVAGKSLTSFIDHFLDVRCERADFIGRVSRGPEDFMRAQFEYNVKKTNTGAKAILSRQCAVSIDGKNYPLAIEKVFGIENDDAALYFVYQLSNHSLMSYSFKFAVEFTFSLLGVQTGDAHVACGDQIHRNLAHETYTLAGATKWTIHDSSLGVSIHFVLQKPVDVWIFPAPAALPADDRAQGITMVVTSPVSLGENGAWSLIGKMTCKKVKMKGPLFDEI